MAENPIAIGGVEIGRGQPLALIAGPCALESEEMVLHVAEALVGIGERLGIGVVFKSSYLKDNRMSHGSYAGPGLDEGLAILSRVKRETGLALITDIHTAEEARSAADVVDALQIPAFLCRQTRLLHAAAETGKPLNIKKGQFMAPEDMGKIAGKAVAAGNPKVLLTERGVSFGYHNLVVDMRAVPIMQGLGYPVVFDATHSVQLPGAAGGVSGGQPEFVPVLARAACAAGCDALFIETHPSPSTALSDAQSMISLAELPRMLEDVLAVARVIRTG